MPRLRPLLKPLLSALIVLCAGYFFFRAFQHNWADIQAHEFRITPLYLVGSALALLAACLLATLAWYTAINALGPSKIDFRQSVAAVNASGLTKYIPGKVWSYALQLYWLDGLGFSKALIVYVNLVNLLLSLGMSLMLGLGCLLFTDGGIPLRPVAYALVGLVIADIACVLFNRPLLIGLFSLTNRLFKRNFSYFEVSKGLLLELHLIQLVAAVASGLGAYLFCFAIGYEVETERALLVVGSSLVADVVGFLAIIVPGGLGVRETLMYAMLGGKGAGSLAIILPVASRMLNMLVDVLLGAVALKLLRSLTARKRAEL
ncbi:MAG TPA: lysylphosphatidylglycerol synthase domain-containing protein [Polyangiaceae bacterium]|nr:lysylphosphatidylglycerol synthase domain-containing protein [Polyangiaceae bacterium]